MIRKRETETINTQRGEWGRVRHLGDTDETKSDNKTWGPQTKKQHQRQTTNKMTEYKQLDNSIQETQG